ncbi:MAG: sigma-70 family RNA polymerase sigma factor [Gemmataceae bacterium]|nr:sigma-70 family RNA polymerase sigma factor [Gemmataceae bacterium]
MALTDQDREEVVQLIAAYQRRLHLYIRSLVADRTDSEEVLQEVNLFIWRHADEYRPGTDFGAWAFKIAYYHVLTHRKKQARQKVRFSDALVAQLAESAAVVAEQTDRRQEALEYCVQKLTEPDRQIVRLRYQGNLSVPAVADRVRRSAKAIYRALDRIHTALLDCVRHRLRVEDSQ